MLLDILVVKIFKMNSTAVNNGQLLYITDGSLNGTTDQEFAYTNAYAQQLELLHSLTRLQHRSTELNYQPQIDDLIRNISVAANSENLAKQLLSERTMMLHSMYNPVNAIEA